MRKPVHPIRKMRDAFMRGDPDCDLKLIARHVKPLLDALEREHVPDFGEGHGGSPRGEWEETHPLDCPTCRLLAAWRAKP